MTGRFFDWRSLLKMEMRGKQASESSSNDLHFQTLFNARLYGAFHTAELFFLFGNFNDGQQPGRGVVYTPSATDLTFSQAMMGYWARFAATGNPNGGGAVAWPLYDPTTDSMLQLDDTFVSINGYHNPQCDYLVTLPQP